MKQFWVEGVYKPAGSGKKKASGAEPFYESFWANTPQEALKMASESIQGGQWMDGPKICKTSEEERMRAMGAPELPLFGTQKPAKKAKK